MDDHHPQSMVPPYPSPRREMNEEDLLAHVAALEAALIPCLPYAEIIAFNEPSKLHKRSLNVYRKVDVEKFARDFMEVAKRLHLCFIALQSQREAEPTKEQLLQKEIAIMEEKLQKKNDLIQKCSQLIQAWRGEVKELLDLQLDYMEFV